MTHVMALENGLRAFLDRHSLRNMGLFVLPGVSSMFALTMGPDKERNEVGGFLIHPLINGLMADGQPRMFEGKPSSDKFRRPSPAKMLFDVPPDTVALESWSPVGFALAFIRPLLSFVSQVVPSINRRGIALKLA
jgi:hypothetical protein